MTTFVIKNVKLESIIDENDMVKFDVLTEKGCGTFTEYLIFDEHGNTYRTERVDCNITHNMGDEMESLFNMDDELVPYSEIYDTVESMIDGSTTTLETEK